MMLAKLSLRNIKKSFKDYAIYFFTLILGVAIFYVFNAIESQTVLLNVTSSTYDIIELMTNMLEGVSVFVSFILGFLIIYASRFLIKRRNKEFGIYLTLGMSKKKISTILLFETMLIGIISLLVGLGVGIVLSQFMSLLVANMFEADMTKFTFVLSSSSVLKSVIYFGIMYLIVMLFNTVIIGKCRLIDLLHGNKKSEEVKLKNQYLCTAIFIISCCALGYAYYLVTAGFTEMQDFDDIFFPIILGAVSTFFIFWSLSGLILKALKNCKKLYYKGLNSFTIRQFSSKINTMVFSITIICLMLFVTICILSSSLSIKNSLAANLDELAPADIYLTKKIDNKEGDLEKLNSTVMETFSNVDLDLKNILKDTVEFNTYRTGDLTMNHTLGNQLERLRKKFLFLQYDTPETLIKISDYNKLAKLYKLEEYNLAEDEYMIIADFDSMVQIRNEALKSGEKIELFGKTLSPKYTECKNGFIEISSNHINSGIILIPDSVANDEYLYRNVIVGNYKVTSNEEKRKVENKLDKISENIDKKEYGNIDTSTRIAIAEASTGLGALVTFIGLYLGIIFLISSAAILALKELSESTDNKERFLMIRKLGADEKLINRALFRQIGIFFLTPLILALIHSVFGIKFCTIILETLGTKELIPSIIMTISFLLIIYGGYFLLTYYCSKNIIKNKF